MDDSYFHHLCHFWLQQLSDQSLLVTESLFISGINKGSDSGRTKFTSYPSALEFVEVYISVLSVSDSVVACMYSVDIIGHSSSDIF